MDVNQDSGAVFTGAKDYLLLYWRIKMQQVKAEFVLPHLYSFSNTHKRCVGRY